jgi:hypothetical protein
MIERTSPEIVVEQGIWAKLDRLIVDRIRFNPRKILLTGLLSFVAVVVSGALKDGGPADEAGVPAEVREAGRTITCVTLEELARKADIEMPPGVDCAGYHIFLPGEPVVSGAGQAQASESIEEPTVAPQAVAMSTPAQQRLVDDNRELRAEVARLSNQQNRFEQELSEVDSENSGLVAENQRLRVALADALASADSAVNQAAIQSALEVRAEYADQVCFRRDQSDSDRIASLCARLGDQ